MKFSSSCGVHNFGVNYARKKTNTSFYWKFNALFPQRIKYEAYLKLGNELGNYAILVKNNFPLKYRYLKLRWFSDFLSDIEWKSSKSCIINSKQYTGTGGSVSGVFWKIQRALNFHKVATFFLEKINDFFSSVFFLSMKFNKTALKVIWQSFFIQCSF